MIKGFTKKGKEFFKFNTNMTEAIRKVDVFEKTVYLQCEYAYIISEDGKDKFSFTSPDVINDSDLLTPPGRDTHAAMLHTSTISTCTTCVQLSAGNV